MNLNSCVDLDKKSLRGIWNKSDWEKELTDPNRICIGVINSETKEILGICTAWSVIDELHITFLAVNPIHQRKGIGKLLMSNLLKRSYSLLKNQIYLEVKENNEPAKAFYRSMGFKTIGKRTNFYKDGSNAIMFSKQLNIFKRKNK